MVKYSLDGIHCRDCGHDLERNLEGKEGIIDASVSFGAKIVMVNHVPGQIKISPCHRGFQLLSTNFSYTPSILPVPMRSLVGTGLLSLLIISLISNTLINIYSVQGAPTENGGEGSSPTIQLILDDYEKEVDVSPGSNGTVSFELEVICDLPEGLTDDIFCSVILETKAHWWDVTTIPQLNFTGEIDHYSTLIEVRVPTNTSSEDDLDLEVWGTWAYSSGNMTGQIELVRGHIDVVPFYELYIGCNNPEILAKVGERVTFQILVVNRGNSDILILLEVISNSDHIDIGTYEGSIFMVKGEARNITFTVRQEPSRSKESSIELIFTIGEDDNNIEYDQIVVLKTEPKLTTIFYELRFTILVVIIVVIAIAAIVLYIYEKRSGEDLEYNEDDDYEDI